MSQVRCTRQHHTQASIQASGGMQTPIGMCQQVLWVTMWTLT